MVSEQTAEWSAMVQKHRKAEWELHKQQVDAGREEMKRVIDVVKVNQDKQLQMKHDKLVKKMLFSFPGRGCLKKSRKITFMTL